MQKGVEARIESRMRKMDWMPACSFDKMWLQPTLKRIILAHLPLTKLNAIVGLMRCKISSAPYKLFLSHTLFTIFKLKETSESLNLQPLASQVTMSKPSAFLEPSLRTKTGDLAIVLLARDVYEPVLLEESTGAVDGYNEGKVLNTRFGSFPHSTLLDVPWGSQIRASNVDTGSRGRKRRRETTGDETGTSTPAQEEEKQITPAADEPAKKAVAAASGFVHILRPTPELWTSSLPHRTQVVYTPDYSYVLSRIRARPGARIIEAGSGSGSFTHASARAVYNGYPNDAQDKKGKVFSFEFNEARHLKMKEEVVDHHLEGLVYLAHRDVYNDGFLADGESPNATSVFLDVPKPWEALRHLSRRKPQRKEGGEESGQEWVSPLDPTKTARICTFSPCIEQVMSTVTELRKLGWVDVDMVEIAHKRLNILREKTGLNVTKDKASNAAPADVKESVNRLKENQNKTIAFHEKKPEGDETEEGMDLDTPAKGGNDQANSTSVEEKPWMEGRLIHRPEAELKTHTSYLVFANLPCEWSEEEEAAALAKWPCGNETKTIGSIDKASRKKEKREMLQSKKKQKTEHIEQKKKEREQREAEAQPNV